MSQVKANQNFKRGSQFMNCGIMTRLTQYLIHIVRMTNYGSIHPMDHQKISEYISITIESG